MASELVERLAQLLCEQPAQTALELRARLCEMTDCAPEDLELAVVSQILQSTPLFYSDSASPGMLPRWFAMPFEHLARIEQSARAAERRVVGGAEANLELYDWQKRALDAWRKSKYRGVIEAVTGAGKTRVALHAIRGAVRDGLAACVLIPTIELQEQWESQVIAAIGDGASVGRLGGGRHGSLVNRRTKCLLATIQSGMSQHLLPHGRKGAVGRR